MGEHMLHPGTLMKVNCSSNIYDRQSIHNPERFVMANLFVVILQADTKPTYGYKFAEVITSSCVRGWVIMSNLSEV